MILDYVLDKSSLKYNKNMDFSLKYKILDDILYDKNITESLLKIKYKINYNFYKLFLYLSKSKNYYFIFPPDVTKTVTDKNLFGMYDFEVIKLYDSNYNNIVLHTKKFNKNDIEKLKKYI